MKKWFLITAISATLSALSMVPSYAVPVFDGDYADIYLKQNTFPSDLEEKNVYLDSVDSADEASTVMGHVGSQAGVQLVTFSSTTDYLWSAEGFATIKAVDGAINEITITAPGYYFEDLIFSINLTKTIEDLTVTVEDMSGLSESYTGLYSLVGSGENAILALADFGTLMKSITLTSTEGIDSFGFEEGIDQLKQTQISGLTPVPEPATMILFGTGLFGLSGLARKKRS
ncbi:MAG: PEP-CTERM sorting domain-containing protein [Desulfobulbus sp.]|nr:PEP-CTERM sorting domain-containing protein [Desulfobulbus sp.]